MITSQIFFVFVIPYKGSYGFPLLSMSHLQQSPLPMPSANFIQKCHPRRSHWQLSATALRHSAKSFDFSSLAGWENYYRQQELLAGDQDHYDEWHSALPLEVIASMIPSNANCLCIGCGTSRLPSAIIEQRRKPQEEHTPSEPSRIVLFDSSPSCLRLLESFSSILLPLASVCSKKGMAQLWNMFVEMPQNSLTTLSSLKSANNVSLTSLWTKDWAMPFCVQKVSMGHCEIWWRNPPRFLSGVDSIC